MHSDVPSSRRGLSVSGTNNGGGPFVYARPHYIQNLKGPGRLLKNLSVRTI